MHTSRSKDDNTKKKKTGSPSSIRLDLSFLIHILDNTYTGNSTNNSGERIGFLKQWEVRASFFCLSCTLWSITFIFSSWGDHKVGPLDSVAYLRHITLRYSARRKKQTLILECKFDTSLRLSFNLTVYPLICELMDHSSLQTRDLHENQSMLNPNYH